MEQNIKAITTGKTKTTYKLFLILAMSTAILLVSPVLVLLAIGYFFDHLLHTTPLYMLIGCIIGFMSGIYNVFRMMKLMQKNKRSKNIVT